MGSPKITSDHYLSREYLDLRPGYLDEVYRALQPKPPRKLMTPEVYFEILCWGVIIVLVTLLIYLHMTGLL